MLSALVHPFLAVALTTCPLQVEVLNAAADRIGAGYITQAEGQAVARRVRDWAAEGRYAEQCDDPAAFAEAATRDLRTLDGHFRLTPPPSSGPSTGPAPASLQAWRDEARAAGGGVREVRVLEGNIGYLRLSAFYPWDLVETRLAAALPLLGDVDASSSTCAATAAGMDARPINWSPVCCPKAPRSAGSNDARAGFLTPRRHAPCPPSGPTRRSPS